MKTSPASIRSGVTLLEVLLSLALIGVLLIVLNMAMDFQVRVLRARNGDVEQAQIARAVLQNIAKDARSVVVYDPIDLSALQAAAESLDVTALAGAASLASGASMNVDEGAIEDAASVTSTEPTSIPGLFGDLTSLQIDISRLPRVDEYQAALNDTSGSTPDIPSDVKTVAYFLRTGDELTADGLPAWGEDESVQTGLVRRQIDRAAARWASDQGSLGGLDGGELLAPEVNYLEFHYYDGQDWLDAWDSEEMGRLPAAIEILVGVDPNYGRDPANTPEMSAENLAEFTYRQVVRLPVAYPFYTGEIEDEETEEPAQ